MRQSGIPSPKLFAIYIDYLCYLLLNANIGCHIENTFINHIIYADDVCLFAPTLCSLQKLLNICEKIGFSNCINFNPSKSMYVVFNPKKRHYFIPSMIFKSTVLLPKCDVKYLGFILKDNLCDKAAISEELRTLYIRANMILRTFNKCNTDIKKEFFRSYSTSFCCHLWTSYTKKHVIKN